MTVGDIIEKFSQGGSFNWGLNTAVNALKPDCIYTLSAKEGVFEIVEWAENQGTAPTPQEIRDEYIRHRTIAECLEYFNSKQTNK